MFTELILQTGLKRSPVRKLTCTEVAITTLSESVEKAFFLFGGKY